MMLFHFVPRNVSSAPPVPLPFLALVNCNGESSLMELILLSCSSVIGVDTLSQAKATWSGFQSIFLGLN